MFFVCLVTHFELLHYFSMIKVAPCGTVSDFVALVIVQDLIQSALAFRQVWPSP
jgi:hypothetical protein